ncbi:FkbM family methyltransferase [Paracoccus onubensis]|uniref:FkbM family methyltransferase n=1 Tax=Paracoccus onubensis TaxID=1675788 RepID=A0A418SMV3_9RHOB|nr:FkbM family methyltransferase [Paracoccus onubensis]RJE82227.1 FkbM family methyltransferase [Paracoccus onubensis]
MSVSTEHLFSIPYLRTRIRHSKLEYEIEIDVPVRGGHRPAVRCCLAGNYYEPFSHVNFKKILDYRKNGSAIHAGTFFGDMLHTYSRSARMVYAFEPVLENYVLAKQNAERLGLRNVVLVNAALSRENGIMSLSTHDAEGGFLGGASGFHNENIGRCELVPTFRIDDFKTEDICLIQLDVEGHELSALEGAANTITRHSPVILIEDNLKNCGPFLNNLDYAHCFTRGGLSYWARQADYDFVSTLRGDPQTG